MVGDPRWHERSVHVGRLRASHGRATGNCASDSTAELKAWLDRGPLLMDGARWSALHRFVGIDYDADGLYVRLQRMEYPLSQLVTAAR